MDDKTCDVCQASAQQSCSSCHASFYCSRECQKRDWKNHKSNCISYSVEIHPVYGRYVVATRDIAAGEVVMREVAAAAGPKQLSKPLCLGCHIPVDGSYTCSKCKFHLCSDNCETSPFHEAECHVLSKAKRKINVESFDEPSPAYDFILPLRCLLTKYTDPKKWKIINNLQDSVEKLNPSFRQRIQTNVIDYLKIFMNFSGVNSDDIYRIHGIMQTNSFEAIHNKQRVEGVFPKVAMMAHDCSPNTENVFVSNDLKAQVRATRRIRKGESITTTYTYLIWNTLRRREHLLNFKYFECTCKRCGDPTELGSHLSTLRCTKCQGNILNTDPLSEDTDWKCNKCGHCVSTKEVERINDVLSSALIKRDKTQLRPLEDLINVCQRTLHPCHQLLNEAKYAWIHICGNFPEYRYRDISKVQLLTKISYCRDLLDTFSSLFPERSQFRGFILFELHASLKVMAKKLLSFGNLNNENMQDYLDEAENCLQETKNIFYFENEMKARGLEEKLSLLAKDFEE